MYERVGGPGRVRRVVKVRCVMKGSTLIVVE